MAGFWAGFGQGWQAESDRIERRKMFMDEQKERRTGMILDLASKFGAGSYSAAGGGEEGGAVTDPELYAETLIEMGADKTAVAELMAQDPTGVAVQAAYEGIQERFQNGKNVLTPEIVNSVVRGTKVSVMEGTPFDWGQFDGLLSPEDIALGEAITPPPKPVVRVTNADLTPAQPGIEDVNKAVETLNKGLATELTAQKSELERIQQENPNSQAAVDAADKAAQYDYAIKQLETTGNVIPGIELAGNAVYSGLVSNFPNLAEMNLGPWERAKQPQASAGNMKTYASEEEAAAAFRSGQLSVGETVIINGEPVVIE